MRIIASDPNNTLVPGVLGYDPVRILCKVVRPESHLHFDHLLARSGFFLSKGLGHRISPRSVEIWSWELRSRDSIMAAMVPMAIELISVRLSHGRYVARARATAPAAGAQIWIRVEFLAPVQHPWREAYDRVLAVLDIQ